MAGPGGLNLRFAAFLSGDWLQTWVNAASKVQPFFRFETFLSFTPGDLSPSYVVIYSCIACSCCLRCIQHFSFLAFFAAWIFPLSLLLFSMSFGWEVHTKGSIAVSLSGKKVCDITAINPIAHLPQYNALLCTSCKSLAPVRKLKVHLATTHKYLKTNERRAITKNFRALPVAQTPDDLQQLPDGSAPLAFPSPPAVGHYCAQCPWFKTIWWGTFRSHLRTAHDSRFEPVRREDVSCYLQR